MAAPRTTPPAKAEEPIVREVQINYEGNELKAQGYPPQDLSVGQVVKFIPNPAGMLELTFEQGSNFAKLGDNTSLKLEGYQPEAVVQRLMEADEQTNLQKKEEDLHQKNAVQVEMNAFPFMCELTAGLTARGVWKPKSNGSYEGGVPTHPRK